MKDFAVLLPLILSICYQIYCLKFIGSNRFWKWWLVQILFLICGHLAVATAQIAPAISIEHQMSNGVQQTSVGAGIESWKYDMVTAQIFKNGFAINAILQTTPLFLVEVQNMSVKRGFKRNSTIALLGGVRFHNLRIRAGAVLGQYDKKKDMDEGINFVVKCSVGVKFWRLN